MKNLNICNVSLNKLDIAENTGHSFCYGYSEDSKDGEVFACSHNLILSCFNKNFEQKWVKDLSEVASSSNSVVNVTLITFNGAVCVGLSNGEIFNVKDDGNACELAGVCDGGFQTMEWSPDQELVVVVTKDNKMMLMSYLFDSIHEVMLSEDQFGEGQFITVGWGKKETQFHGSVGKQAAKEKIEVVADPNALIEPAKITWRGDGQFYAVGVTMDGIRRFKVFNREGHLQYTSEKQPGLEANLTWRPSGNVIAATQKLPHNYAVAFFEKNGLKHGGFDIPGDVIVENISWSNDSEIIALQCKGTTEDIQKILLFTTANYHWYLKQTVVFNNGGINIMIWDNNFDIANNKKLHVILNSGKMFSYTWIWDINHSVGKDNNDNAVVCVIDGSKVLLTGFRQTVVPPPMSALELHTKSGINEINFYKGKNNESFNSNTFFIITEDDEVVFYKPTQNNPLQYQIIAEGKLTDVEIPFERYNWLWMNPNTVTCIQHSCNSYNILEFQVIIKDKVSSFELKQTKALSAGVMRCNIHPNDDTKLFIHLNDGDIIEYSSGCEGDINPMDATIPAACPKFSVLSLDNKLIFIGLSHKGNLYLNDALVMNNVSSYFIHTHFLLITTLQHLLLCTELTKVGIEGIRSHQKIESPYVYKRVIERGSRLIIAVPNDTRTVFQLPRGNLEAIQPRPLSLKIIGEYLDALNYDKAFDLMRKQRINLNLIYDHDPKRFMENSDTFLDIINNVSWLNLFLSELDNCDVTKTMYSSSYAHKSSKVTKSDANKVSNICEEIRNKINSRQDKDDKILPLLTTYVKSNTITDLEHALAIIKQLKVEECNGVTKPVGSDEAIKYLLYMVEVNNLFNVALGMYDFDLVLLVASKSQKDPKEYVPMLNEFNEMEENYMRFSVNKHLKRFDRAVEWLAKCGVERNNELLTFVKYHSLYRKALEVLNPENDVYKQLENDYGTYLKLNNHLVEAGVVFSRAENYEKAIECYTKAVEWELAIELAYSWPKEQFQLLCCDLVNDLKNQKRDREALMILESYICDVTESILYAITTTQFKSALRLCAQYQREDLRENLHQGISLEFDDLKTLIQENAAEFIHHRSRLQVVRETRQAHSGYDGGFSKDCDLYSDAGSTIASNTSRTSSKTYRSSKNRRKHERKIASLKEGSQYENLAIIRALHSLIARTHQLRERVRNVNVALLGFRRDKDASVLQSMLDKLLKDMKASFKEIWSNEFALEAINAVIAVSNLPEGTTIVPQGIALLDPEMRTPPVIPDIRWKLEGLKSF